MYVSEPFILFCPTELYTENRGELNRTKRKRSRSCRMAGGAAGGCRERTSNGKQKGAREEEGVLNKTQILRTLFPAHTEAERAREAVKQ